MIFMVNIFIFIYLVLRIILFYIIIFYKISNLEKKCNRYNEGINVLFWGFSDVNKLNVIML